MLGKGRFVIEAKRLPGNALMAATVRTTCPYCGVGCGVLARPVKGSVEIAGDTRHPANFGRLCSKGSALGATTGLDGRLLFPQVNGERSSWDDAPPPRCAEILTDSP